MCIATTTAVQQPPSSLGAPKQCCCARLQESAGHSLTDYTQCTVPKARRRQCKQGGSAANNVLPQPKCCWFMRTCNHPWWRCEYVGKPTSLILPHRLGHALERARIALVIASSWNAPNIPNRPTALRKAPSSLQAHGQCSLLAHPTQLLADDDANVAVHVRTTRPL